MRWEDCVKRDLAGVGGEWRKRARDRMGEWGNKTGNVTKNRKSTSGIKRKATQTC